MKYIRAVSSKSVYEGSRLFNELDGGMKVRIEVLFIINVGINTHLFDDMGNMLDEITYRREIVEIDLTKISLNYRCLPSTHRTAMEEGDNLARLWRFMVKGLLKRGCVEIDCPVDFDNVEFLMNLGECKVHSMLKPRYESQLGPRYQKHGTLRVIKSLIREMRR